MPLKIYLDQCAASEIAKDPKWEELRDFLKNSADCAVAICPLPFDTILESSRCKLPETRESIFSFYQSVSGGFIFRQFFDILVDEILSIVRPHHQVAGFDYTWEMGRLCELSLQIGADFEELRNERNSTLSSWVDPPRSPDMSFEDVIKSVSLEPVAKLWRDLQLIADSTDAQSISCFEIPKITDSLIENKLTVKEAMDLANELKNHAMSKIPVMFIHNRLAAAGSYALLKRPEEKLNYNDIIDQERLSVALAFADFVVTDKRMVARIEKSGAYEICKCQVFKVSHLSDFECSLKSQLSVWKNI